MNSPDQDELLSAYIDGQASRENVERIESDPALMARASALRATSEAVAQPVKTPSAAVVDASIAAAIEQSATAPNVTALATRTPRHRRVVGIAAAAAIVAIAFLAGAVVLSLDSDGTSEDDLAASLESTESTDASSDSAADAAEATPPNAATEPAELPAEERAEEAAGEASPEQAPSEATAADGDQGADDTPAAADVAEEAADVAEEEGASEFADDSETDVPEFPDAAAMVAAIEAAVLVPEETTQLLPCGLEVPAAPAGSEPLVFTALLPEGAALMTGWWTEDGFHADRLIQIDSCTSLPLPAG